MTAIGNEQKHIIVGITGASGAIYARRLLDVLEQAGVFVHLVVSAHGRQILAEELGIHNLSDTAILGRSSERLLIYRNNNLRARIASGSFLCEGMIIAPCSSNTLAATAAGLARTLLQRAAQVCLKQRRKLLLLHREMPVSAIDLQNMLRLAQAGAIICPASPAMYLRPKGIDELVDFVVGRIVDLFGVEHDLPIRWPAADASDDHGKDELR